MSWRLWLGLGVSAATGAVLVAVAVFCEPTVEPAHRQAHRPNGNGPRDTHTIELLAALEGNDRNAQSKAIDRLMGCASKECAIPAIASFLRRCDSRTDDRLVGACLTVLRQEGEEAKSSGETLVALMSERAPLYDQRDKYEVVRLRAFVLLTLADTGNADAAIPYIHDYIANAEEFGHGYEAGVGAHAAGKLGPRGGEFVDELLVLFQRRFDSPVFSLERYEPDFPESEGTTVQREIFRAFQCIGYGDDENVCRLLEDCAASKHYQAREDSQIAQQAKLLLLRRTSLSPSYHPTSPQSVPQRVFRDVAKALAVNYVDQDGNPGVLSDLVDRPSVFVFFYTRCTNAQKCSATVSRLAELQQLLQRERLQERVRLVGITYEPKSDDSNRLRAYGDSRKITFDASTRFLRLDPSQHDKLISTLNIPVSYNDGWVSVHGISLILLDGNKRLICRFDTVAWDNKPVLDELRALLPSSASD